MGMVLQAAIRVSSDGCSVSCAGAVSAEARVIIETKPGEEGQVDYGTGPMVRDPDSGKYRRTRLFVLTLGCSRKSVRLLVFQDRVRGCGPSCTRRPFAGWAVRRGSRSWTTFARAVLSADVYDPCLNPPCIVTFWRITA